MKKLSQKKIKDQLQELQADPATQELILSTLQHHNDLVDDYNADDKHQQYLCYQLKQQLFKMLMDLKKHNKTSGSGDGQDKLTAMMQNIKGNKVETRN